MLKIKNVSLDIVCGVTSRLPDTGQPEIAFAGKSNVGKSSLINALVNRKSLARTSSSPGKTQTINYYHVNDSFYLVDLPGYGYASASQKAREAWGKMVERYLNQSANLRTVFLLVDIRHAPSANDKMMYEWIMTGGYRPVIIATKADKIKRSQRQKQLRLLRDTLELPPGIEIISFSAKTRDGKDVILGKMQEILRSPE
jgi:GTP-binding protein